MQPILIRAVPSSNSTLIAFNNIKCIAIVYDLTIYRVRTIQIQETNVISKISFISNFICKEYTFNMSCTYFFDWVELEIFVLLLI